MKVKNSWKRVVAGMLAVLVMAATVPAGTDFGGYFGGTDIVASAETSEQSETFATNQRKTTYNGTNVTITAQHAGSSYGMVLSTNKSATISVADGYQITKVEFTKGNYDINQIRSKAGNVTISGDVATVSDVNAQSLTVNGSGTLQIKQVKVYYEPVSAEKSEIIVTNMGLNTYYGTNVTITADDKGDPTGMLLGTDSATISVSDEYIITKVELTKGYGDINDLRSSAGKVTRSGDVATVSDVNAQSLVVSATPHDVNIKQVKVYYTEKTEWAVGENINLNGKWFFYDDFYEDMDAERVRGSNSSAVVPTPIYDDDTNQWVFGNFIFADQYSEGPSAYIRNMDTETEVPLYIKKPSDKSSAVKPSGFKIKSGSGTQADPYTFELVYPPKVDVTGVDLNKTTATIPYGSTEPLTLTATVAPDGATDKTVTWSSSNTDVATVDANGKVTAVKAGTAAITATATNGTADDTTDDKTATCTVTVSKIDSTVKTAPAAIEGLTYNGKLQELITAGTSEDGTVQYALVENGDSPEYTIIMRDTNEALKTSDIEINTIYTPDLNGSSEGFAGVYIDCQVVIGDVTYTNLKLFNNGEDFMFKSNYTESVILPEGCDGLLITDIDSGYVYAEFVDSDNPGEIDVDIDEDAWVESIPKETDAGDYDVYYRVKGDANHNNTKPTKIDGVKIAKADATVTAPTPLELTYTGKAQALVTEGTTTGGTLLYAVNTDPSTEPALFTNDIPSETNVGTYYVWYTLDGEDNYNDTDPKYVTVTIKKATATVTATKPTNGTLTVDKTNAAWGETVTVTPKANDGYVLKGVYLNGKQMAVNDKGKYQFEMPKNNVNVTAVFEKKQFTVTATKPTNGTLTADKTNVAWGETVTVTPTANDGYIIKGVYLNGRQMAVNDKGKYQFEMPKHNVNVTAVFEKKQFTVTATKPTNGTLTADKTNVAWGETVTVTPTANDGYVIKGVYLNGKQMAVNDKGKYQFEMPKNNVNVTAVFEKKQSSIVRVSGDTRFDTAAEISKASFTKADTVVLAYGLNYADALAGVTLANKLNAPILLTHTAKLPDETLAEIKRLGAKKVIILGGTGAISRDVEKSLKKNGLTTERYAGTTRFGTATAIAEKLNDKPTDIYFVYAFNHADALSVSTVAALKNAPIIYLRTSGELDKDTADYLAKLKKAGSVKNAYVIGGTGVISDAMMKKAGDALGVKSTRIAGKNRYATCVEVNKKFADVLKGDKICVATGMNFPDALAGGVYAAKNKAPLFLINGNEKTPNLLAEQKSFLKAKNSHDIIIFGGTGAVSDSAVKAITDTITEKAKK